MACYLFTVKPFLNWCSVRENFEGHAGPRTHKNIWIAGPASQLLVLTVGTNIILTNYCQSSRTCKCFICQSTPSFASLGPRTCKFHRDCDVDFLWVVPLGYKLSNLNQNSKRKKKRRKCSWKQWKKSSVGQVIAWCQGRQAITWPNDITDLRHYRASPSLKGLLTHWGRDKMAGIFQTTFWNQFSWMKMCKFG